MKRNWGLIRCILGHVEENGNGAPITMPDLESYSREQSDYHVKLCAEAGLITMPSIERISPRPMFSLTWAGHNTLETLRQGKAPLYCISRTGLRAQYARRRVSPGGTEVCPALRATM